MTYISLFSSAGVGCHGFKMEGFQCVATNELIPRRLDIQRFNNKCKYDSGYICGDITQNSTIDLIRTELYRWESVEKCKELDVFIATPPCQGMSVANHKKSDMEIIRNSLVVESIKLVKEFRPRIFIFENVPAFMKTICTDIDGIDKPIAEAIQHHLGSDYSYAIRIINLKDYGACSSRSRTLVIGVRKDYADDISPYELFPERKAERTLRQVIGKIQPLTRMGEIDSQDIYHSFRMYPEHMRSWISGLKEGESAFDNKDLSLRPHQIINDVFVENQRKNGDKYRRQIWDKTGPCVHTRNDQLASQNTIHPNDDRVFSIRELMILMTIPNDFKWSQYNLDELNGMSETEKIAYLKKEEIKIRQSLGEAVPTEIFRGIASNIKRCLFHRKWTIREIDTLLQSSLFSSFEKMLCYLLKNPDNLSFSTLARIAELANSKRTENAAYYTNKFIITDILNNIPNITKETIRILEPSVGVGVFLPLILKRFDTKHIIIDAVDVDPHSIEIAKTLLTHIEIPDTVQINFICEDFLTHAFVNSKTYDYVIGNPPFGKVINNPKKLRLYKSNVVNTQTNNVCSFFLDKCINLSSIIALVMPKAILNIPEFKSTRDYLEKLSISTILDFGEKGFKGVLIETTALIIETEKKPDKTIVSSITENITMIQQQSYICAKEYPYWIIYRDALFDRVANDLVFGVFTVFRDRQITNNHLKTSGNIPVIKSRNVNDTGTLIESISGYDAFIDKEVAKSLAVYKYIDTDRIYLSPNMTYKPRVIQKPKNTLVNGSVAILIPNDGVIPTTEQLLFFSSQEYRAFYRIARNYQTRSLNIDSCSVYFFGLRKEV